MLLDFARAGVPSVWRGEPARRVLEFPEDRECAWLVALGYPVDRPLAPIARPDRRPLADVVHRERWERPTRG